MMYNVYSYIYILKTLMFNTGGGLGGQRGRGALRVGQKRVRHAIKKATRSRPKTNIKPDLYV